MEWAKGNIPKSHILKGSRDLCLEQEKLKLRDLYLKKELDEKEYKIKLRKLALED